MNKLDKYITKEIIEYLPNEDVLKLEKLNKFYNSIFEISYINYIKYRKHPLVFNVFDNMCLICNMGFLYLLDEPFTFTRCNHN